MISFACIVPHPPILLPTVGSEEDRAKLKKTLKALDILAGFFQKSAPDIIVISSPHPDWGFTVPLYFLAKEFKGKIAKILIGSEPAQFYFEQGTEFSISPGHLPAQPAGQANFQFSIKSQIQNPKIALVASGDLSHVLKKDGPYGFNPQGPKFDKALIKFLKEKNIEKILELDEMFPEAGECGLRSFAFLLGILEASKTKWQPEVLSHEGPFGVGYLVANLALKP